MAPNNAINYSAVGLPLQSWGPSKNILLAGSIPCVVLGIWYLTRRIKRRLIYHQE